MIHDGMSLGSSARFNSMLVHCLWLILEESENKEWNIYRWWKLNSRHFLCHLLSSDKSVTAVATTTSRNLPKIFYWQQDTAHATPSSNSFCRGAFTLFPIDVESTQQYTSLCNRYCKKPYRSFAISNGCTMGQHEWFTNSGSITSYVIPCFVRLCTRFLWQCRVFAAVASVLRNVSLMLPRLIFGRRECLGMSIGRNFGCKDDMQDQSMYFYLWYQRTTISDAAAAAYHYFIDFLPNIMLLSYYSNEQSLLQQEQFTVQSAERV